MKVFNIFYDSSFTSFPWRIKLGLVRHFSSEASRDAAIRITISWMKSRGYGKISRINVYDEFDQLAFTIIRVK